ncbi:MAG: sulfate/thiosulfate transport system permease protein [Actinomycetota bacterium]|jgi:sulfate transport system permease protein|nr:sulfate/thiosulfate transport system permease protein [Actinomycetota bacterium]
MSTQPALAAGGARQKLLRWSLIGVSLLYVLILLLAPFAGIVWIALKEGFSAITDTLTRSDVTHAYYLTLIITVITVAVTTIFGVLTAWVLVRHRFFGRGFMNALVDLPFAVSPIIVGLMCVILFGRGGWFEPFFSSRGIQVIFALPSMILVTAFICIPFVIRGVAPILVELGTDEEEAAKTLGATPFKTFLRVTLPNIRWGLLYGIALSTARALGEVGAVLIVSGSIQGQTETATLYILRALEERQEAQGYLVALTLAAISVFILLGIEYLKNKRTKEQSA